MKITKHIKKGISNISMELSKKKNINKYQLILNNKENYENIEKDAKNLNWSLISQNNLSNDFIDRFFNYIKWSELSRFKTFNEESLDKYKKNLNWNIICEHTELNERLIEKYLDIILKNNCMLYICVFQKLSNNFIKKHIDILDLNVLLFNKKVDEKLIEEEIIDKNRINDDIWHIISTTQKFSEKFMIKYHNFLFWDRIIETNQLREEFISQIYELNDDYIEWDLILGFQLNLSESFIIKYFDKFNSSSIDNLCRYQNLSYEFIDRYSKKLNWSILLSLKKVNEYLIDKNAEIIPDWAWCSMIQLSIPFIEKYKDKLDWYSISRSQKLTNEFIDKYENRLYWFELCVHQKLSEELMNKYVKKLNSWCWSDISKYQLLSDDFITQHKDKIVWNNLSHYKNFSESFISKFEDKLDINKVFTDSNKIFSKKFIKKHINKIKKENCYNVLRRYSLKIICKQNNLDFYLIDYINEFL